MWKVDYILRDGLPIISRWFHSYENARYLVEALKAHSAVIYDNDGRWAASFAKGVITKSCNNFGTMGGTYG